MKICRELCLTLAVSLAFVIAASTYASSQDVSSIETEQAVLDLSNDGVVMNLSAHPDDEDGATLALYRMKYGTKTYSILFTRGEGGQNETGPDLYEELGVLRTHETHEAGKILGAEVHFLNFVDFGYSKTASETFTKWGGQREVLRRLVFVIRKYKPDVVFTNHGTVEGHGHHQAVAITAIAAFDAAADSSMFPEQLTIPGISPWQPRKLYFRNFGRSSLAADVVNSIGDTNTLRGKSYLYIAADALAQHKTQGMDRADLRRFTRGMSLYRLMRANSIYDRDTTTFFGGIHLWSDPSLRPLAGIREWVSHFKPGVHRDTLLARAAKVLPTIDTARQGSATPLAARILNHWRDEIEKIVQQTCGVSASVTFADKIVVPKQKVPLDFRLSSTECAIGAVSVSLSLPEGWSFEESISAARPQDSKEFTKRFVVTVEENPVFTLPQTVTQYNSIDHEEEVVVRAGYLLDGHGVSLSAKPDFDIAPPIVLSVSPSVARIATTRLREGKKFAFTVRNHRSSKTAGRIIVELPTGWVAEPESYVVSSEDSTTSGAIRVVAPLQTKTGEYLLRFKTGETFADAVVKVFDVNVDSNVRVGIVKSYDNTLESAAKELDVKYKLLDARDFAADLSQYQTIIIDIRSYLVRDDLKKHNQRILEYVREGGNLVVFYQKDQDWKPDYAPFPFSLSRKRVSVEEAPVSILRPDHPLFNVPNKISESDWEGWKQERGVYFPSDVAPQYEQLLSSNDPDEQALTTGYLLAQYGMGSYIYTSYVWYRQLKDYNLGAWRNFVNMICYPNHRRSASTP